MKQLLLRLTLLLGLLPGLVLVAGCQKGIYGDVEGTVVELERGAPVADVQVRLDRTNFVARSDANGIFRFRHVPVGVYALVCSKVTGPYRETTVPNFRVMTDSVTRATVLLEIKASLIYENPKEPVLLSSLKPGCGLFKGRYGLVNDARLPLTNLVLIRHDDKRLISRAGGLHGSVAIGSADQALEFVRLFTGLNTYAYFRGLTPDQSYIEVRPTGGKPGIGELAADRAKRLGIAGPVVTNDESNYYVTRYVMTMAQNLYRIKERVRFDGEYEVTEKTLIIPKMDILLPAS